MQNVCDINKLINYEIVNNYAYIVFDNFACAIFDLSTLNVTIDELKNTLDAIISKNLKTIKH